MPCYDSAHSGICNSDSRFQSTGIKENMPVPEIRPSSSVGNRNIRIKVRQVLKEGCIWN